MPHIDLYVDPASFTQSTVPADALEISLGLDAKQSTYLSKDHSELHVITHSTADVVDIPALWDVLKLINPLDLKMVYLTSLSGIFPKTRSVSKTVDFRSYGTLTLVRRKSLFLSPTFHTD